MRKLDFFANILRMPAGTQGAGTFNGNTTLQQNGYDGERGTVTIQTLEEEGGNDSILDQDIDRRLIEIRPYENPVDTIARNIDSEDVTSMEPKNASRGTLPIEDKVTANVAVSAFNVSTYGASVLIPVQNINMWIKHDTFCVPKKKSSGTGLSATEHWNFYVLEVQHLNNKLLCTLQNDVAELPATGDVLDADVKLQRLATAVNERTAMIDANELLPEYNDNYQQIFMKTISMGLLAERHKKKVDFTFDTLRDLDLWDLKRQIESAYLWGRKAKFADVSDNNKTIYTTNGVWNQIDRDFTLPQTITDTTFIDLTEDAFIGNNGSETKLLFAGHGLMSDLMKSLSYRKYMEQQKTQVVAGVEFHKIKTNHGTLLIKPHSLFVGEHYHDGVILDPAFMFKQYFQRPKVERPDLLKAGKDRSENEVVWEASALCLKNLPTHLRIISPR